MASRRLSTVRWRCGGASCLAHHLQNTCAGIAEDLECRPTRRREGLSAGRPRRVDHRNPCAPQSPLHGFLARKCDVGLRLSGIWRKRRIAIGRRVGWLWTPPLPLWPKSPPSTVRSSWRIAGAAVAVRLVVESPPTALMLRSPFASLAAVAAVHDPYLPTPLLLREHQLHLDPVSWPVGCRGFASTTICSGDSDPGVKAWLRCPGPRRDSGQISAASSALTEARTHER